MKTIGPLWVWKPSLSSRWPFSCDGVIFGKKRKIYVNIKGFAPVSVSQRKNCATRKMSIYTKLHEIFSRKDWVSCISEEINGEKSIARGVDPWTTKKHAHLVVEGVSSRRDLLLLLISSLTLRWAPTSVYKRSDIKLHTIFFQNYLSKHTKLIIQGVLRSRKKNISNNWKN